ncbi:LysR substrate-binding domain-containing protein [Bordetella avium]|uniref:LysR substrate-binding domain-containing protein n=1 Tax=Bordetella avium TaxID=521 RepID=UPI000E0C2CE9|nr:LysR substrate-binding domain-containing protein [Bordetella avium]AZY54132.1 LysR family transcriptional regulator [Bordetella avium]RIQ15096.1 LysR family transcriptional regulator [Bordetella avium]RIQ38793.1 LysR family transcriptional regulator [Bordetella avium]RIQ43333.1 LysR family transcriptional regulator [Bordetella avium]RIQ43732.1 LysR family transcriptional regulator [Bordetella avium]
MNRAADILHRLATRLKMRHLRLLLMIRQHGSLTRVAQHMATSQPAVTSALAEIEAMFGAPLFTRSIRGMVPTPLGEIALARAQAMLQDLDHLARDMEAAANGHAGHIKVGVIPFVSGQLISAAIARTLPGGRRVTVTVHEGTSDHLLGQLQEHALDAVIARAAAPAMRDKLQFEVLYRQRPRLIASRRLAARLTQSKLGWNDLSDLDWILGTAHTPMREQVAALFLSVGLPPPMPVVETNSSKLIGEMVAASERAVSALPADIADELVRIAGVAVVPFTFEWKLPPIALFTRSDAQAREVDGLFAQALRDVCAQMHGR